MLTKSLKNEESGITATCWRIAQVVLNPDQDTVRIAMHGYADLARYANGEGHISERVIDLEGCEAVLAGSGTWLENVQSAVLGLDKFTDAKLEADVARADPAEEVVDLVP